MRLRDAVLIAMTLLAAGCSSASRIQPEPPAELANFSPEWEVKERWSTSVGSLAGKYDSRLTPSLDNGVLYLASAKGRVSAVAADSGNSLWEKDLDTWITSATAVGDGLVVVGTRGGDIIALDAARGEPRWTAKVSTEAQAPAAVRNGVVVVQTIDGKVTGLDAKDGKRLWLFERSEPALSLRGTAAPILAADFVLTGFANGKVVALQSKDGKLLWEYTVAQPRGRNEVERLVDVDSPVLLWGDTLFAVAYQGKVIAVDTRSGRLIWSRDISSYAGLDASRDAVFVTDEKGYISAFDQRTGANLWRQEKMYGRGVGTPIVQNNAVVVGDFEGYLHWLAQDDGHFVARYRLDSLPVRSRGILDGDTLYFAGQSGRLVALQLVRSR